MQSDEIQGAGVSLDLGEEKAALERGEEGDGEGVRVGDPLTPAPPP